MGLTFFSIHWLSFTVWASYSEIEPLLSSFGFDLDAFAFTGHGGQGYTQLYAREDGLKIYTAPSGENAAQACHIEMPGQACEHTDLNDLLAGIAFLRGTRWRWHVTRCDMAWDTQDIKVGSVQWAINRDLFTSYVKKDNFDYWKNKTGTGETVYVGSKNSDKRLRVYLRSEENHFAFGEQNYSRFELQLRHEYADKIFQLVCFLPMEQWSEAAMGVLRGFIDFDFKGWNEWMGVIPKAKVVLKHETPSVERRREWVEYQVAPTLAILAQTIGKDMDSITADGEIKDGAVDLFRYLVQVGAERLKKEHLAMIRNYKPGRRVRVAQFDEEFWMPKRDVTETIPQAVIDMWHSQGRVGKWPLQSRV